MSGDSRPIRLAASDNTSGLLADRNDLLVLYSGGIIPGWHCARLLPEELTPLASPFLPGALALIRARLSLRCGPQTDLRS